MHWHVKKRVGRENNLWHEQRSLSMRNVVVEAAHRGWIIVATTTNSFQIVARTTKNSLIVATTKRIFYIVFTTNRSFHLVVATSWALSSWSIRYAVARTRIKAKQLGTHTVILGHEYYWGIKPPSKNGKQRPWNRQKCPGLSCTERPGWVACQGGPLSEWGYETNLSSKKGF